MNNKILLAVDEEIIDDFLSALNSRRAGKSTVIKAKADAEQIVKDKCIALIDEILACRMADMFSGLILVSDIEKIKEKLC